MKNNKSIFLKILIAVAVLGVIVLVASKEENAPQATLSDIGAQVFVVEDGSLQFISERFKFSLNYPETLEVEVFDEDDGAYTALFSSKTEAKNGFQIFVTPTNFDGISKERILNDNPSMIIEEPLDVILGDGTRALIFWSSDVAVGKTREVWFVQDKYLYQITTYEHLDTWLANIMKTWKFIRE